MAEFESGFESNLPPPEVRIKKRGGESEFVRVDPSTGGRLGGPRPGRVKGKGHKKGIKPVAQPVDDTFADVRKAVERDFDLEMRALFKEANAELKQRRKNEKRRLIAEQKRVAAGMPADMVCPFCHNEKPNQRQWVKANIAGNIVAMCIGCMRVLRKANVVQ